MLTKDTGELWGVLLEYKLWCIFCLSHYRTICKIIYVRPRYKRTRLYCVWDKPILICPRRRSSRACASTEGNCMKQSSVYIYIYIYICSISPKNLYVKCYAGFGVWWHLLDIPDSKVHGANIGPTWVLPTPDGPHVGPMNLAIREVTAFCILLIIRGNWCSGGEASWSICLNSTIPAPT